MVEKHSINEGCPSIGNKIKIREKEHIINPDPEEEEEDRFTGLPENILVRIVCLLPLKDAVATSVLSKRWQYIWTWTNNLDFDGDQIIDRYQQRNERGNFITLRVRVLELLECYCPGNTTSSFVFPSNKFLKILSLDCVQVSQEVLESLLSKYPLLERLEVLHSDALINLRIRGPSLALKHLKLKNCYNVESIEICDAVNLVSFQYCNCHDPLDDPPLRLVLRNAPKLVNVDISLFNVNYLHHAFATILCCISHLQILHLAALNYMDNIPYPILPNPKELKLFLDVFYELIFFHIHPFLEKAPNLQRLVLKLKHWGLFINEPAACKKPATRPHHYCLKEVEVTGYSGYSSDDELILYLIESAVSIEKIIVNPCESEEWHVQSTMFEEQGRDHALRHMKEKIPKTIKKFMSLTYIEIAAVIAI
ncbi:putative FBD-associated F-box protein At5g38570 [Ziziphus jujuba]|uniref:FBD-associated F-box protein At5g38570 n=1 Tax=Ziziphus jujuba TaxID=326968 RepID=A0ABM3ZTQ5_ZIZJJ|nr:putative FBD-associated F-box protein At5g38570 [Ziziphus jujuba]